MASPSRLMRTGRISSAIPKKLRQHTQDGAVVRPYSEFSDTNHVNEPQPHARDRTIENFLIGAFVFAGFVTALVVLVRELIRVEEFGSGESSAPLPRKMQEIAGIENPGVDRSKDPAETDPDLPSLDDAYLNPELLRDLGVDGIMFERSADKTYRVTGSRKRRRRTLDGVYARVYVLDETGTYRTLASVDWFDAKHVLMELEDQARDLAGRLGVPFQVI